MHPRRACVSVCADTLAWRVFVRCGHCVRMRVRAGETRTQIGGGTYTDGGGGTWMNGSGGTWMDGGGGTRMDGGSGTLIRMVVAAPGQMVVVLKSQ